jgi:hypothetical protein
MNIIELFENLNIDKSSLLQITSEEIIRIEKHVNVEKKINPDIDVNVANNLIEALKKYPSEFQFIANNRILYNFFSKKSYYRDSFPSQNIEVDNERVKTFLENYLLDDLLLFFDKKSIENKFEEMNDLLVYKEYFPEELLYKVSKRAEGKLDFVLSVLNANEQNYFPILFAKQASFYTFLSHFASTEIDDKVHYLLNEIVDIYNVTKTSEFASSIMISMANYHSFDEELMDTIASNKRIVQDNIDGREGKSSSSGLRFSWRVFAIILFVLIRVGVFTKQCSSSGSSDYDINNSENMNTIMESIEEKYVNEKNHFFNYLSDFKTINIDSLNNIDTLKTGDKVFKSMYSSKFEEQIPDSLKINIKNKSDFDIVVLISDKVNPNSNFNQPRYSVFLKKKESINVSKDDLFNFYVGNELASFLSNDTEIIKYDKEHEYRFIKQSPKSKEILKVDYGFNSDVVIRNYDQSVRIETKEESENDSKGDVVDAVKIN